MKYLCKLLKMRIHLIIFSILAAGMLTGCEYQKVLKKGSLEQKLDVARKYYNKGDYARAEIMLDQLLGKFPRGGNAEEVYFLYSYCHYGMNEYALASYHFQNYVERYPNTKYTEQAAFMVAKCAYAGSLASELDQTETKKAIEAIQLFINKYSQSELVEQSNELIDELRARLHSKALSKAELFYKMENYLAAYTTYKNAIATYPDLPNKTMASFYMVKSSFLYAKQSVQEYQLERYTKALNEATEFLIEYPEHKKKDEINDLKERCTNLIDKLKTEDTTSK